MVGSGPELIALKWRSRVLRNLTLSRAWGRTVNAGPQHDGLTTQLAGGSN